jgi:hypothetical protein
MNRLLLVVKYSAFSESLIIGPSVDIKISPVLVLVIVYTGIDTNEYQRNTRL